jgi:RIO-like serine/threonine protein kinase
VVIKIHRLGRTSFRSVRKNRDYMENKSKAGWLYMSRLAAIKEFSFMQALHGRGFPTPSPIDQNRHVVVMSRIHGYPLSQIQGESLIDIPLLFLQSVQILKRLVACGLIHCDFNEFNLMISATPAPTAAATGAQTLPTDGGEAASAVDHLIMIDFPQIISVNHPNAAEMFQRDLHGVLKYFTHKLKYSLEDGPGEGEGGEDKKRDLISLLSDATESSPVLPRARSEAEQRVREMLIEELVGKDGEVIQLPEILESLSRERREKERKEKEERARRRAAGEAEAEEEQGAVEQRDGDIYEEIKRRQYHGGGMSHDDDRTLIEFLAHNREHKAEMMREMKGGEAQAENQEDEEDGGAKEPSAAEEEEGDSGSGPEEEEQEEEGGASQSQPPKSQEEIRNALRRSAKPPHHSPPLTAPSSLPPSVRTQPQKHSARQGSRNSTKKRNKYGKVERINVHQEW